jgi:ribosomal protein S4
MFIKKKSRYKPLYKQFNKLRANVQERKKLFKFKKKKWEKLQLAIKNNLKKYNKYKAKNQAGYYVTEFANKGNTAKKEFRNALYSARRFRLYYGNLSKKFLKKQLKLTLKKKKIKNYFLEFLKPFEKRLDTTIYKARFSVSLRNARQLILHGKIFVNKNLIKNPSYVLNNGDTVSINPEYCFLVRKNLKKLKKNWPTPPRHLIINYKTMEIIMIYHSSIYNISLNFPNYLHLEEILCKYYWC